MRAPEPRAGRPNPAGSPKTVFRSDCARCNAQLRIVDDLPAEVDVAKSFHKGVTESFVVVPTTDPEDLIQPRPSPGADLRSQGQPRVAGMDEVARVEQIMALAAGQAEQDQPVCSDCLKQVVAEVERQVEQAAEENRTYLEAHQRLQEELENSGGAQEVADLEADIAAMEEEEKQLLAELEACKREEDEVLAELARQRRQEEQLRREEDEFWLDVADCQLGIDEDEEERAATAAAIRYASAELQRLRRTNVLNEMFHISQEGPFGTINGFRLGRLPEQPVPWEEVNAAWGQACLLLDALVKRSGLPTTQYRLLPRGSYSAIQVGGDVLELYSSDGGLSRFFLDRRFDLAMSAFLGCLREVARFVQRDATMRLPFPIEGDKVGGFSVRVQFNQDERWTKALKFMLADLKWIIAFVESREFSGRAAG